MFTVHQVVRRLFVCPAVAAGIVFMVNAPVQAQTPTSLRLCKDEVSLRTATTVCGAVLESLRASAVSMIEDADGVGAADEGGQPAKPPAPTPAHTGIRALIKSLGRDITNLPSRENLFIASVGGGLALGVHPIDHTTNRHLTGPTLDIFFNPGAVMGQSYTLFPVAFTVYAVGRIADQPKVSHMGGDLIKSLAIAELITQTLKYTVRRERPDHSGANSFPSGHAADTMAFATALERHLNWHYYVPAYAFASYVAVSRLHDNVHFISDVFAGATVGIIAGRTVTRHGRENFPVQTMVIPGGFGVLYVRRSN